MTVIPVLKWWGAMMLLGAGCLPLTGRLFRKFDDRGWLFSKVLGLMCGGYLLWALCTAGIVPFTAGSVLCAAILFSALIWIIWFLRKRGKDAGNGAGRVEPVRIRLILAEELFFAAVLCFWVYVIGFRPEAYGTEKYMDYGFMAVMNRSTRVPAPDIWFGTDPINYYYGGQHYAVWLAKLTGSRIQEAYNLMRALIAALVTVMPFSLVRQLLTIRFGKSTKVVPVLGGLLASASAACAGNVHYLLYGLFGKFFRLPGWETYWFPDSTRYIGHNPPTGDECIHEFPSYSFVLGDLHAHMINLIFVLLFLGVLTAWLLSRKDRRRLFSGHLILLGAMTGLFKWTNYWDYVIYLTVLIFGLILAAVWDFRRGRDLLRCLVRMAVCVLLGRLSALPFTASFQMMVSEVAFVRQRTALYQFAVLWGLPVVTLLLYAGRLLWTARSRKTEVSNPEAERSGSLRTEQALPAVITLLFGICAFGLILLPEIVYVRDIYENGYARSNTMFKLTYQAYLLFGLFFGFAFPELLRLCASEHRNASGSHSGSRVGVINLIAGVLLVLQLLTAGYLPYAVSCWFGPVLQPSVRKGLDATAFLRETYPEDWAAIRWLEEQIAGTPVVLEGYGDSYSNACRVSAMTGLPTVEGWYVHEWLWRENVDELNRRRQDIDAIYQTTAERAADTRRLLESYGVSYIFVGSCEREQYPALDAEALCALGTVVYGTPDGTFLVQVQ